MLLKLYSTLDGLNVINKTLSLVSEINVRLPKEIDISNFDLILKGGANLDLEIVNYVELVDIRRKYFVNRCVNLGSSLWRLSLTCDLLETYKDEILASKCSYLAKPASGDKLSSRVTYSEEESITTYLGAEGFKGSSTIILTTIAGYIE